MKKILIFPLFAFFLLIFLSVIFTGCRPRSTIIVPIQSRTLHLGHMAPVDSVFDILAHRIKEYVETRSNGRYNIMIYAGGTLGPNQMLVESMISGTVDMAIVTNPDVSNYARDLRVLDLPFQFLDWDEVYRFLHSDIIKEFYKVSEVMSISTLAFMPRGFHHVTNNKGPITKPSDFLNMKIRIVGNETYMDTFTALGADPLSMPWDETYTALRDGRMEGNENTIITLNDYRIYEVQKYLSKTGHFFAFATVIASPIMFNSIMSDDQELIRKAAFDAALDLGDEQLAAENGAAANLEKNGIMINEIGDKQPFIDLMEPVYEKFFRNHNRRYYDLIKSAIK